MNLDSVPLVTTFYLHTLQSMDLSYLQGLQLKIKLGHCTYLLFLQQFQELNVLLFKLLFFQQKQTMVFSHLSQVS
jgi:alpha-D-ribose 1-methylphosphonate 5-triphosphate synthase subunit PhnL